MKFLLLLFVFLGVTMFLNTSLFSQGLLSQSGLQSLSVYESTDGVSVFTFDKSDPRLTTNVNQNPPDFQHDFLGTPDEYYDLYVSRADGTTDPTGQCLTIECYFNSNHGGVGGNIDAVSLNFGNGSKTWAQSVTSYVQGQPEFPRENPQVSNCLGINDNACTYMGYGYSRLTISFSPCPSLTVSPFYQTDSRWGSHQYDHAGDKLWNPTHKTISWWGCAMTSMAMIAQYYGVTTGADGKPVNPDNLNSWLNANNGYVTVAGQSYGDVKWASLKGYTKGRVEYVGGTTTKSENILLADLSAAMPVVLGVNNGGHYLVATGKSDCAHYDIDDPLSSRNTSLSAYGNNWAFLRRFRSTGLHKTNGAASTQVLVAAAPGIELLATDSLGNRTGYDPLLDTVFEDAPNISYYIDNLALDTASADSIAIQDSIPTPRIASLFFDGADTGHVQLTIHAKDSAHYSLEVTTYKDTSDSQTVGTLDGTLLVGSSQTVSLRVGSCCLLKTGNVNGTGTVDLADLSALVSYLTGGGFVLPCPAAANVNGIGTVDLGDLSSLVSYLTGGGFVLPNCP